MKESTFIRTVLIACLFVALLLPSGLTFNVSQIEPPFTLAAAAGSVTTANARPGASEFTFYRLRPDLRRCASPLCGGYFVKRVNRSNTRCADGRWMSECYVAEIEWNGNSTVDPNKALLRGDLALKQFTGFRRFGVLRVSESWQAASDNLPTGEFRRVKDRGLRCITFPCPTHYEAKLNSFVEGNIAGVDLKPAQASEQLVNDAFASLTGPQGILVAGQHAPVRGPGGRANELKASQFYLRASKTASGKQCFKTGCSSQVCADKAMITTCEWRDEYACYQKAKCERQADGKCGFTKTPELTACLRRAK